MSDPLEWTRYLAEALFDEQVMALIQEGWAEYDSWKRALAISIERRWLETGSVV